MRIGVPAEGPDQPLVAATPHTVGLLTRLGYEVVVEHGAGASARFPDSSYDEAGAALVDAADVWASDIVIALDAPDNDLVATMRPGAALIARLDPRRDTGLAERLAPHGITALAMDAVPRISRAQAMDVLSSQANVAGYRAVVEAASCFGRVFTGQVTAAGKMPPARVYVIGAGVAGLAAIGTAHSMGALVSATDVRPEVAEQVESMGASFVALPTAQEESSDGYAREMDEDAAAAAARLYASQAAASDIVITTANIPGRTAPILLDEAAVAAMAPGSVIVDMAAANGGNCALTVPGRVITTDNGVTIVGYEDFAARLPSQASQLYGRNIVNLLTLMTPGKDGQLVIDLDDEVVRGIAVTERGRVMWPPPPVQVSAAPTAPAGPSPEEVEAARLADEERARRSRRLVRIGTAAAAAALAALILATPAAATGHYIVLLLSVVLGFYVISNVTPALHTPLMSVTNAISGIILVGGISQIGDPHPVIAGASFAAIVLASINIFGGFAVTHRMLAMFRK
ncbi:Re/Si-specific NAD(P)(+) transhydrogenase subunit alpha [Actinomyces sp. B33]|uniref:Re/Si-specific NAD(P)(+) transhydrogenase subunit alpha n=1 Tax=Actinomyces sp. B33 TaxID=2942131 RepID=UPI002340E746|nr:Re/Si-specific NAD(P)(+) transhydrogenase subunit alpha [Actinomyces sp. B33]MDC4233907.1 Re/Si-specific NAD(P)(+) transhydrogenase subunit alpha [Actinomyces sp. B33]